MDADDLIGGALPRAAAALEALDRAELPVRERELQVALAEQIPGGDIERRVHVPGWDPQPGGLDVLVRDPSGELTHVVETKLKSTNDIYECLWDFAKVLSLSSGSSAPLPYVVAGTTIAGWSRHAGRELFENGTHDLVGAIERYREWWIKYILGDSTGRPTEVPTEIHVEVIACTPVRLKGLDWELKAVRVSAGEEWTPFAGGLPVEP
jgi:hypothetical protein